MYAFGFLFMLPQLFVNYKLKSVAQLPWRAFMYKVRSRSNAIKITTVFHNCESWFDIFLCPSRPSTHSLTTFSLSSSQCPLHTAWRVSEMTSCSWFTCTKGICILSIKAVSTLAESSRWIPRPRRRRRPNNILSFCWLVIDLVSFSLNKMQHMSEVTFALFRHYIWP